MAQETKRVVGYDQDYPGGYRWPIYEILCPECGKWCREYGEVDILINGEWVPLCLECGRDFSDKDDE